MNTQYRVRIKKDDRRLVIYLTIPGETEKGCLLGLRKLLKIKYGDWEIERILKGYGK